MIAADGITVETLNDGRLEITFRQSGLSTLEECLERGRLLANVPKVENDAACIGTALHHACEVGINDWLIPGVGHADPDYLNSRAVDMFVSLSETPGFIWAKYDMDSALTFLRGAVNLWWEEVYPLLQPTHAELNFEPFTFYENDEFVLRLTGTIDLVDARLGLVDWKTSGGRQWQAWEKARWSMQPTVYLRAALELDLVSMHDAPWPFTYFVFENAKQIKLRRITVTRDFGDFDWLAEKCLRIAQLIKADLPSWPLTDDHALCSEKWCPVFAECKGKHMTEGWTKRYDQGWPLDSDGQGAFVLLRESKSSALTSGAGGTK